MNPNTKHRICRIFLAMAWVLVAGNVFANPNVFFRAVQQNNESKVVELTLKEFNLNTRNPNNEHALHVALRAGALQVVDFLLLQNIVEVEARNPQGESPLMLAALKGHLQQAKRLIERRAEVNKPGWTPLHYAASNEAPISVAMVRLLLEHHAYIDAESPNRTTPLMMAAHYGHPDVVQLLLDEGADASIKNEQGLSALDFARRAGRKTSFERIAAFMRSQASQQQ